MAEPYFITIYIFPARRGVAEGEAGSTQMRMFALL
jgi:hypothetical protein